MSNEARIEVVDEVVDESHLVYKCFRCEALFVYCLFSVRGVELPKEPDFSKPEYCPFCGTERLHD